MISEYISANQFRVEQDRTGEFKTGRRIKAYCGVDGYVYSTILSSSYSDPYTTITIVENMLTSNLEDVLYGIVNIGETGAFPDHLHDGTEGQGGALPHITATDFSTYSGTLQIQIDNKPDTFLELSDTPSSYDSGKYARSTSSGIVWTTAGSSNVQTFLDLTDTPTTYSGHTGKLLKVTSSGVDFLQLPAYNLFTAASGLPVADSGNPSDYYINFNTGDVYEYAKSGEYFETTRTNLSTMPHTVSHTLNGDPTYVSNGLGNQWWQDDINTNQWLSIDIGTAKPMYKIILAGGSDGTDRVPKNFRIEGSSNNTDWNIVYTGITVMTAVSQTFVFPSSSAEYRYWRLYMIDNWGSALIQINRFELYSGRTSNTYVWQVRGNVRTPTFKDLTDVPYTYSGTAGKFAQSTGSGIVWATASGSGYWYDGYSTPSGSLGVVNDYYINSTSNKIYKKQISGSPFFTAKSVIIDMTNNWTDGSYVGLRSVELYLSGSKVSTPLSALTGYDTSASFDPIHAFKNEVVKTGSSTTTNGWTSDPSSVTNQRIVCVFSSPVTFDSMVINNYHHSGGSTTRGAKDINVYYSTDTITTSTYGAAISNSALIFTGQLHQHAASDAADNQTLTLINNYSVGWNVVLNTVNSFSGLIDVPSTYSGTGGMFAQSTGSGIVWATISGAGSAPITTGTKGDLSGGLVTETWGNNTGNLFSGYMSDTHISASATTTNYSTAVELEFANLAYNEYRNILLKFNIRNCIGSKTISSAVLKLYCTDAGSVPVNLYRVLKDWNSTEATWNNYKTGSTWNTAGCKAGTSFPVDDSPTADFYNQPICTSSNINLNAWFTMDITSIVQAWSLGTHKEYGVVLFGGEAQFNFSKAYSNEGTDGFRPKLEISYYADAQVDSSTLLDGQIAITSEEYYNAYILNKSLGKWVVQNGNKYQLTSDLPTGSAFSINVGTRVYDIQASSWKEWTGSIWKLVETFIDLDDTPSTYSGTAGKFAQSTGSGIMWTTISGGSSNVQSFLDLTDVPHTYSDTVGKFAQSTGSGIVWTTVSAGSSDIQTFLDLTDTPNEYSEGLFAQSTASGIVWATASGSSAQTFIELTDTPSSYAGQEGKFVKVVGNALEFATVSGLGGSYDSSWFFELDENGGLMPSTGSGILDIQSFLDLTDTPDAYSDGKFAQATTSGIIWATPGSSDVQTFLDLADVPSTYSGTVGKFAQSTGSGIVWATISGLEGADGVDGTNGTNGTNGLDGSNGNVWLSDTGAPSSSLGSNYDFYFDEANGDIYAKDVPSTTNVLSGGTISSTTPPVTNLSNVLDGNTSTFTAGGTAGSYYGQANNEIKYDLGAGNETIVTSSRHYASYASCDRYTIQGSNNNVDWTILYDRIDDNNPAGWRESGEFTNTTAYRYYRIYCTKAGNGFGLSEWQLIGATYVWDLKFNTRGPAGATASGIAFLDLTDTPNTYSGTSGMYAQSTGSGIVWATVSGGSGASSFIDLTDTPNSYSNGKFAQSTEDGIVWTTVSGGGTGTSYGELELTYASDIVLDFTEYNLQSVILTGNTNFTFTNMTNGKPCVLNVIQDAQGGRAATFQSNIRWPQGVIPTTSSGSGLYDIFTFIQTRGTICGSCSAAFQLGS